MFFCENVLGSLLLGYYRDYFRSLPCEFQTELHIRCALNRDVQRSLYPLTTFRLVQIMI